jgi:hypothetical protein
MTRYSQGSSALTPRLRHEPHTGRVPSQRTLRSRQLLHASGTRLRFEEFGISQGLVGFTAVTKWKTPSCSYVHKVKQQKEEEINWGIRIFPDATAGSANSRYMRGWRCLLELGQCECFGS